MSVLLFGATGMVGQGVLRECLLDPEVQRVVTIGRAATGAQHLKLRQIVHPDLWHYAEIESGLSGFDACFFCLGVSSAGMKAEEYARITYGITMAAAETLSRLNPQMTFIYVSGAGTDSTEKGRTMWARVKGKTENALLPLLRRVFPNQVLTTEEIGRAMLTVVRRGYPKPILETRDIRAVLQPR